MDQDQRLLTLDAYEYPLPSDLIAQEPVEPRHNSRLMVVYRHKALVEHHFFYELADLLSPGHCLVLNDSKVIPARLRGRKPTGGKVEILLVRQLDPCTWSAMTRPGLKLGQRVDMGETLHLSCTVTGLTPEGFRLLAFDKCGEALHAALYSLGEMPTPPYIRRSLREPTSYQTVFASVEGSVAAPTAGLHFTNELLERIRARGIHTVFITLHVGPGTFLPVKEHKISKHIMHSEYCKISHESAQFINSCRGAGGKIVAVGTTVVRALETASDAQGTIRPYEGETDLFIYPGYQFKAVDAMVTNFHLPRSTLLMLVAAFMGYELTMEAYKTAIRERYRFYSFGDAMLIL